MGENGLFVDGAAERGSLHRLRSAVFEALAYHMSVQGLRECLMCALPQEGARPIWLEKAKGDVISVGKCYSLRGLFTLISRTHGHTIHFAHTHADALTLCSHARIQTHTPSSAVQGLSGQLVMVHRVTDNKLKSTHRLLSLVGLC